MKSCRLGAVLSNHIVLPYKYYYDQHTKYMRDKTDRNYGLKYEELGYICIYIHIFTHIYIGNFQLHV